MGRLLIVDDEPNLRRVLARTCALMGTPLRKQTASNPHCPCLPNVITML
jgi:hypothetical protein